MNFPKSENLKLLQEQGLNVPEFIIIPASGYDVEQILKDFSQQKYAVRSCAANEDLWTSSQAWQFLTQIDVAPEELASAIDKVVQQAKSMLAQDISLESFSLIIQRYIQADYAGVCFTRNPSGGREFIIEYHKGIWEDLVSWKVVPQRQTLYWNQKTNNFLPNFRNEKQKLIMIERYFDFPQDIEWCIKDDKWYFLQTRPITTITQDQYQETKTLEAVLQDEPPFFLYEKNELSEVAPRPTPFTYELLQKIYAKKGPVAQVYRRYGIKYKDTSFLKILWNELYVDRKKEKGSLFGTRKQKFINIWRISKIKPSDQLEQKLEQALQKKPIQQNSPQNSSQDLQEQVQYFLKEYQITFEINLVAIKLYKQLEQLFKRENISLVNVLAYSGDLFENKTHKDLSTCVSADRIGNTLEITDQTVFKVVRQQAHDQKNTQKVDARRKSIANRKQNMFHPKIAQLLKYQRYREYGRRLMIKNLTTLKKVLPPEILSFSSTSYDTYLPYTFPSPILSEYKESVKKFFGVSPGTARWTIVNEENLSEIKGPKILQVQNLDPKLIRYFDQIEGIISQNGWILSHLAILAREQKIPVVVSSQNFSISNQVEIDGTTGSIRKL